MATKIIVEVEGIEIDNSVPYETLLVKMIIESSGGVSFVRYPNGNSGYEPDGLVHEAVQRFAEANGLSKKGGHGNPHCTGTARVTLNASRAREILGLPEGKVPCQGKGIVCYGPFWPSKTNDTTCRSLSCKNK